MHTITGNPNAGWKTKLNLPDDNNKPTAAMFEALFTPLLDNTAYLKARGIQAVARTTSDVGGSGVPVGPAGSMNVWQNFGSGLGLTPYVDVPDCLTSDLLLVLAMGSFANEDQTMGSIGLSAVQDYGGANTAAAVEGAEALVFADIADAHPDHITIFGWKVVTAAGPARFYLQGRNTLNAGRVGIYPGSVFSMIAARLRLY